MNWNDGITEFGFDCKVRKLSPKTISNYTKQLWYFQRFVKAEFNLERIEKVKRVHIKQFLSSMDDKGRKPRYINDLLKVIKTFYNYLVREGEVSVSPASHIKNMKMPKTRIITFSEDEIRKLLNHFSGRSFLDVRNKTMLALFFDTGMRLNKVITLQWEQIRDIISWSTAKGRRNVWYQYPPILEKHYYSL